MSKNCFFFQKKISRDRVPPEGLFIQTRENFGLFQVKNIFFPMKNGRPKKNWLSHVILIPPLPWLSVCVLIPPPAPPTSGLAVCLSRALSSLTLWYGTDIQPRITTWLRRFLLKLMVSPESWTLSAYFEHPKSYLNPRSHVVILW